MGAKAGGSESGYSEQDDGATQTYRLHKMDDGAHAGDAMVRRRPRTPVRQQRQ